MREELEDEASGTWLGVVVNGRDRRPRLRVEAGAGRRMRVAIDGAPVLWARVAPDHHGYAYLRAHAGRRSLGLAPPFTFASARSGRHAPGSDAWLRRWCFAFAREFTQGRPAALGSGATFIGPCAATRSSATRESRLGVRVCVPALVEVARAFDVTMHDFELWDTCERTSPPIAFRSPSPAGDGRVKAFRKLAREGTLPPVAFAWISGLQRYVLLDGHDRLHAALLEGVSPACLAVLQVSPRARPLAGPRAASAGAIHEQLAQALTDGPRSGGAPLPFPTANRLLLAAFDDRDEYDVRSRALPLTGGSAVWDAEVRLALARLGEEDEDLMADG